MADAHPTGLILAGGLALGAYQAGALGVLLRDPRISPVAIAGASIGAINGAILASSPPGEAGERLSAFWDALAIDQTTRLWTDPFGFEQGPLRHLGSWLGAATVRLAGSPPLFRPRTVFDSEHGPTPSLYVNERARETLKAVVDFERLNRGPIRFCCATTDIETGECVTFDTARGDEIGLEHLLASSGLPPAFSSRRIEGRLLADGGLSANAPLEPLLSSARRQPTPPLCFLLDLFATDAETPDSLEKSAERATDLKFGCQTVMRLAAIERERALEMEIGGGRGVDGCDLYFLSYRAARDEAGPEKPYDFSARTLEARAQAGAADAQDALARLEACGEPGLRVHRIRRAPAPG